MYNNGMVDLWDGRSQTGFSNDIDRPFLKVLKIDLSNRVYLRGNISYACLYIPWYTILLLCCVYDHI